jgi:hypothetical protein
MKYDPEALTRHVLDCAQQGMSQIDVAELAACVALNDTPHMHCNIKLERKKREYGPNSDYYKKAGADQQHNADGAEDGDAAKLEAAAGRAASVARRTKARDAKDAAERLRLKLEGVTDKHERYEITYAHCIWEFEQMYYRQRQTRPAAGWPAQADHNGSVYA